ncbi:endospore germination permease [Neobacillus sp. 3P2-tot-E-2]|uniref:GerAB/ArcD/ProY family transporter n=1 Tax=Neobacillus sp. 3P2-tot-E-2 TaxID=3132212 RepID=UPI0039A3BC88
MKIGGSLVKVEKDLIGIREFFSIIVFMISTKATDMTTTRLFGDTFNAAWMVIIGSFVIILPSIIVLNLVLKKYQTKNLIELLQMAMGRHIAFGIGFILFIFLLVNTSVESRSYADQLITMNFPKTPLFILYTALLLICLWGANKGWEALGSVAWMVFPYVTVALGILVFLLAKDSVINRLFPLFGPGKWEVAKSSFENVTMYAEAFFVSMLYPFVKDHKTYTRGLFGSLVYTVLMMMILYICYTLVFDYRSVGKITYPFNEATRLVSIGRVITNIETFFLTFWLLVIIVKFAVYLYLVSMLFGYVFNIKEFEHTLIPITILVLLLGMIPTNQIENIFIYKRNIIIYSKYMFLLLPPLLWLLLKVKEVRNR